MILTLDLSDISFSNEDLGWYPQSWSDTLQKSVAFLHLSLRYPVEERRFLSISCLTMSKSRSSFVQPLSDEWFLDRKNIHSSFLSFQKSKEIIVLLLSTMLLSFYLCLKRFVQGNILVASKKTHQKWKYFHILCFDFIKEHLHDDQCLHIHRSSNIDSQCSD